MQELTCITSLCLPLHVGFYLQDSTWRPPVRSPTTSTLAKPLASPGPYLTYSPGSIWYVCSLPPFGNTFSTFGSHAYAVQPHIWEAHHLTGHSSLPLCSTWKCGWTPELSSGPPVLSSYAHFPDLIHSLALYVIQMLMTPKFMAPWPLLLLWTLTHTSNCLLQISIQISAQPHRITVSQKELLISTPSPLPVSFISSSDSSTCPCI